MDVVRTWQEAGLAWIEISRPEKLNALDRLTLRALRATVRQVCAAEETRVVLLTGSGDRAFAAGADIAEMDAQDAAGVRALMELGKEVSQLLEDAPQPVLAVVNGYALGGGCELTLACDLVLAAENAQFGLPEIDLGVLPGWGGTQRLERRVGYGRARDMILTGRRVGAQEALSWGLCDRMCPLASLREEATALARVLAAKDPLALTMIKRALRAPSVTSREEGLLLETELFVELFDRPEREEAMGRFLKRR